MISMLTYFAFTSLSTVGFGDYTPRSDLERGVGAFMLLSGVAIFSIIMGQFINILENYSKFNEENNDSDRLRRFFGVLHHYNKDLPLDPKLLEHLEIFFEHRWKHDKNMAFRLEEDA